MELSPYIYYYIQSIFIPYKHSLFLFIMSALFVDQLIFVRKELQSEYIRRLFDKSHYRGLDWMQMRTIHVEGLLFDDLSGELLRHKIDSALESHGIYKRVD